MLSVALGVCSQQRSLSPELVAAAGGVGALRESHRASHAGNVHTRSHKSIHHIQTGICAHHIEVREAERWQRFCCRRQNLVQKAPACSALSCLSKMDVTAGSLVSHRGVFQGDLPRLRILCLTQKKMCAFFTAFFFSLDLSQWKMVEIDPSGFGDGRNSSHPVLYSCSMPFTL